jgi:hypothetical protein
MLIAMPGAPAELTLDDGGCVVTAVSAEPVAPAQRRALDERAARDQLTRLGDTPYALRALTLRAENAFLPVSTLNALRRDAAALLRAARLRRPARRALPLDAAREAIGAPASVPQSRAPAIIAQTPRLADTARLLAAGAGAVYWSPEDYRPAALDRALETADAPRVWLTLPPLAWGQELEELAAWIRRRADRLAGAVLTNPGQCALDLAGLPWVADAPFNVFNAASADLLRRAGCARVTLSPELNAAEIAEAMAATNAKCAWELAVYGRAQLMLLSHCPRRVAAGESACAACRQGEPLPPLVDRKGYAFPLRSLRLPHGCHIRLLNSLPTWLPDKHARVLRGLGERAALAWRLCFAEEPPALCETLTRRAAAIRAGASPEGPPPLARTTSGHFARGVE